MADNDIKYGFRWVKNYNGGKTCPEPQEMQIASGYQASIGGNVNLSIGDPVKLASSGTIQLNDGSEGTPAATYGIIVGFKQRFDSTLGISGAIRPTTNMPGGTTYTRDRDRSIALVVPAAAGRWSIQCDDAVTATTRATYQALVGENCDHILTEDTSLLKARPRLDISGHQTATAQWRIDGIDGTVSNEDFSGNFVSLLVVVNETQQAPFVTAGV